MSFLKNAVAAIFRPTRQIGPFTAQVTIDERHHDELVITDHPVEQGAVISDHAYKRPAELMIRCGWSNSGGAGLSNIISTGSFAYINEVYQRLLTLQESRIPFGIITGKRVYNHMLIRSLSTTTTEATEHSLVVVMTCRQVIMVQTKIVTVPPREVHKDPEKTAPVEDKGAKQPAPVSASVLTWGGKYGAVYPGPR